MYSCYLAIYTLVLHSCRGAPIILLYTYNDNKWLSYHILSYYLCIYSVLILNEYRDYVTVHFFNQIIRENLINLHAMHDYS